MALSIEHYITTVTVKSPSGKTVRSRGFTANATKARHDFIQQHAAKGWRIHASFDPSKFYAAKAAARAAKAQQKEN